MAKVHEQVAKLHEEAIKLFGVYVSTNILLLSSLSNSTSRAGRLEISLLNSLQCACWYWCQTDRDDRSGLQWSAGQESASEVQVSLIQM